MTSRPKPPVPRVNPWVPHIANTTPPLLSDLQTPCGLPCETVFHPIPAPAAQSRPFLTTPHALPNPPQQTPFQIAQGKILERCHHSTRADLAGDLHLAAATVTTATLDGDARNRSWRVWTTFCHSANVDPWLRGLPRLQQQTYLLAFGERIRRGHYRAGKQVKSASVETAVRHICQAHLLAGLPDARKTSGAAHLDLPFLRQKRAMSALDPPVRPQLALPVSTIEATTYLLHQHHTPKADATADLITIAFFYLLWVGEYTSLTKNRTMRTVQFRWMDVCLWRNGQLLSHDIPPHTLLTADGATLYIGNQKNGHKGDTLHHEAIPGSFCPVKALARRVAALQQITPSGTAPLSLYSATSQYVLSSDIAAAIKAGALANNLPQRGYDLSQVGPHSLRASGAMACQLNGVPLALIQKLGRTGSTFLRYIHAQIATLTSGVAQLMATQLMFTNVGG